MICCAHGDELAYFMGGGNDYLMKLSACIFHRGILGTELTEITKLDVQIVCDND